MYKVQAILVPPEFSCPPSCACWECTRRSPGWPPWTAGNWSAPRRGAARCRGGQQPPWGFCEGAARQRLLICYWRDWQPESAARGKRLACCRREREREGGGGEAFVNEGWSHRTGVSVRACAKHRQGERRL